ncbi:sel1 repeat family protein [Alteromonas flava]|uniref:sel1 repeat family protein n=1 Tax=Alteromonas flava TaxID=2048003 RepID=UPI000C28C5EE|nr:sel1 repeat family protein [Alteromonas flava]
MSIKKQLLVCAALVTLSLPSLAQERTRDGMWMTEYTNTVQNGLYALNSKNYEKAFNKLSEGAKLGSKEAQFYLAQMYLNGWGMEPDYKLGWMWFKVAMEQRTQEWRDAERQLTAALPADFIKAMEPFVAEHIAQYGAEAQDLRCLKRTQVGSNIREIICEKRSY